MMEKEVEATLRNTDENPITSIAKNEDCCIRNYKFSNEVLKQVALISKCRVNLLQANILHRIENHYCEKIGHPNTYKLNKKQKIQILKQSLKHFNRKPKNYIERQIKRENTIKTFADTYWMLHRIKIISLFNLPLQLWDSESDDANSDIRDKENEYNINKENEVSSSGKEISEDYHFTYNLSDDLNSQPNTQQESEPIGSYSAFQEITLTTSTQKQTVL